MASETKTENVMLTGQTAYFKKQGSMVNRGTIEITDTNTKSYSYAEGYVGPNSVIHGTDLADTSEYEQCEVAMETYLDNHWTIKENERTIVTNSQVVKDLLEPGELSMQEIVDNISNSYKVSTKQFKTKTDLEPIIINDLTALFDITFDMIIGDTEERILLQDDEEKLVVKSVGQKFIVNDREIETIFGGRHVYEIINRNGFISVLIDGVEHITDIEGFSEPLNELQLFPDNIVGAIYSIKYRDITNVLLPQVLHNFIAVYNVKENKVGILDLYTTTFYEDTNNAIKRYTSLVSYIRSTGTQYIDTDFILNAHDKIECKVNVSSTAYYDYQFIWGSRNGSYQNNCNTFFSRFERSNKPVYARTGAETAGSNFLYGSTIVITAKDKVAAWRYASSSSNYGSITTSGTINDCINALFIFDDNTGSGANSKSAENRRVGMYLYYFKVYNNDDELILDLRPCKDLDNVGCLYDMISHKFLYNKGTGTFSIGSEVQE